MTSTKLIFGVCFVAMLIHAVGTWNTTPAAQVCGALECYQCEGEPNGDCAKAVVSSMEVVDCPGGALAMCSHTDLRNGNERSFKRGCTQYANPDLCTLLYRLAAQNPMGLRVFSCNTCWEAKCNIRTTK